MPYTPPSSSPPSALYTASIVRPSPSASGHGRHNSAPLISVSTRPTSVYPSSSYLRQHRRSPTISRRGSQSRESGEVYGCQKKEGRTYTHASDWKLARADRDTSNHAHTVPSPPDSNHNSSDEGGTNSDPDHTKNMPNGPENKVAGDYSGPLTQTASSDMVERRNVDNLSSRLDQLNVGTDASKDGEEVFSKTSDALLLNGAMDIAVQTPDQSDQEDDYSKKKPIMIRKKSGELVRPALRGSSKPKSKSLPGTPTYSKAVHFHQQLEEVRHFLQVDQPLLVSAHSSPTERYNVDSEFPFGVSDPPGRGKNFQWEAHITNFPTNLVARRSMPVRLDRIFLSADNRYLVGVVVVANLAYHKHVVARFTLDYWKTVSEVTAEYNNDIQLKEQATEGYDTFNFNIGLADHPSLDEKRMFICIRYNVAGMEFWDNNNSMNYHIDFTKKYISKKEQSLTSRPATARDASRLASASTLPPNSAMSAKPGVAHQLPLSSSLTDNIFPDSPTRRSGNAFGSRYNFANSLSAAAAPSFSRSIDSAKSQQLDGPSATRSASSHAAVDSRHEIPRSDLISGTLHHQSPTYKELVDKYCFYGSSKQGTDTQNKSDAFPGSTRALEDKVSANNISQNYSPPSFNSSLSSSSNGSPSDEKALALTSFHPRTQSPGRLGPEGFQNASPGLYTYGYRQSPQYSFLSEPATPTAILG